MSKPCVAGSIPAGGTEFLSFLMREFAATSLVEVVDAGPDDGRGVPSGRTLIGVAGVVAPAKGGTPMLRVVAEDAARQDLALTLDEICKRGAERMLAVALEAEVDTYLIVHREARDERGRALVV